MGLWRHRAIRRLIPLISAVALHSSHEERGNAYKSYSPILILITQREIQKTQTS